MASMAWALPGTQDATNEIRLLKDQLERQQRLIEAQDKRLFEQERLMRELAAKLAQPAAAPGTAAAGAVPAPAPANAKAAPSTPPAATLKLPPPVAQAAASPPAPAPSYAGPGGLVLSRYGDIKITLGGAIRTTLNTTTARMQPEVTPFFVLPKLSNVQEGSTKIDARLSGLRLGIEGIRLGDFQLGGLIFAYLFNGDLLSGKYGFYPGMVYAEAVSPDWRFAMGLQMDVFSPRMPGMVDRMSALAASGNPGNSFHAQGRVERYFNLSKTDRLIAELAMSDPLPTNIDPAFTRYTENAGVPNGEGRLLWKHGSASDGAWLAWPEFELGVSAAGGQFRTISPTGLFTAYDTSLWGVALDGAWRIAPRLGFQGEIFTGQALGPYLATIFQTVNLATQQPIRSVGGWGELAWHWTQSLHSHLGYGIDHADPNDVPVGGFTDNQSAFVNLFFDSPKGWSTYGLEGMWRKTDYQGLPSNNGFSVMVSSELRF
jgi:hypothetical protein